MKKLWLFCKDVYDPGVHLYFSLNWYLALHFAISMNHNIGPGVNIHSAVAVVTMFLALFYLRILDEIKDLNYDQQFNQDRPLVKGTITIRELFGVLMVLALLIPTLNFPYANFIPLLLLVEVAYSWFLLPLERSFPWLRDNIIANLFVTYPVNILLSVYVLLLDLYLWQESLKTSDLWIVGAFACAFLYYEFARKISWPHQEKKGERTYSSFFGTIPSAVIANMIAAIAIAIIIFISNTWIPLILVLPLFSGVFKLLKSKTKDKGGSMKLSGTAFIGLFYGILIFMGALKYFNIVI